MALWEEVAKWEKIKVIKNAIENQNYIFNDQIKKEYKKKLGLDEKVVFGHVGAFREQKNQIRLIEIFSEISREMKHSVLVLVGEAVRPDEKEYLNLVKKK